MGVSPQRIFYIEHTIWKALTAIHKKPVITFFFLILTKQACDRSLFFLTDPLVCMVDVITTFIAWNIMPLY